MCSERSRRMKAMFFCERARARARAGMLEPRIRTVKGGVWECIVVDV